MDVSSIKKCAVLKFGGASVHSAHAFSSISEIILDRKKEFPNLVVVVSAMGNTTDELIDLAHQVNPNPPRRELDMLISVGERMSVALLAMALAKKGVDAVSFTGSQTGIITTNDHSDAKIVDVRPKRLLPCLAENKIVIVAGFQGMGLAGDITTLGRGGSDTTAVALAAALHADRVEFFKDVGGVYDQDPKKNAQAKLLRHLNYQEALQIMEAGARVLHARCIRLAQKNQVPLCVLPFAEYKNKDLGTWIGDDQVVNHDQKNAALTPQFEV